MGTAENNRERETRQEEDRILEAYQAREREIPRDRYSLATPSALQIRAVQLEHVARLLRRENMLPLASLALLEVGCGRGQWLVDFESMGALRENLAGIDLDEARLETARRRLCPGADIRAGSAAALPWKTATYDLVFQSTVFTSILDDGLKQRVAQEMLRVVKPSGLIVWYDFSFDNPFNRDVRGVGKREIHRLFPGCSVRFQRVTLAPPLGRFLAGRSRELASILERLRLLNTHLLASIRPFT